VIWHVFEVWLILLAAFLIGCTTGALVYEVVARSGYAVAQGALVDSLGDAVDRIKDRFGLEPAWRPQYERIVETPAPEEVATEVESAGPEDAATMAALMQELREDDDSAVGEAAETEVVRDQPEPAEAPSEPPATTSVAADEDIVPMRPASLAEPRNGVPDNLQRIRGIGERNEMRLNNLGIFHFGQIAAWTPAEMRWVAQQLAFPERIERDDWIGQAIILASGGDTGFTKSAERRRARRQKERKDAGNGDEDFEDGS
jgi:predicted flap endonuclease-1-like 5' DNA nuclease